MTTTAPCATCGRPHRQTRRDGYYADNGKGRHAYRPIEANSGTLTTLNPPKEGQPQVRDKVDMTGFHTSFFGAAYACDHCGATIWSPVDVEVHRRACHPREAA